MNVKHLAARPGLSWCTMSDLICLKVKIKSSPRLSLACRGQWQLPILIYCDKLLSFSHTWEKQMQHWKQAKRAALAMAWLKVQRLVFSERSPHPRPPNLVLYLSCTQHMEGIQIQERSSIYSASNQHAVCDTHTHGCVSDLHMQQLLSGQCMGERRMPCSPGYVWKLRVMGGDCIQRQIFRQHCIRPISLLIP